MSEREKDEGLRRLSIEEAKRRLLNRQFEPHGVASRKPRAQPRDDVSWDEVDDMIDHLGWS